MKFGKSIGCQQDGNVELHYVDYKLLKKRIKDVVEQLQAYELNRALKANSQFEAELEAEIEQVNKCFASRQKQLLDKSSGLSEELQPRHALEVPSEVAEGLVEQRDAFRRLVDILGEVDKLRKYAVWNAVAVVKILKKRRKQTHFGLEDTAAERAAWLQRQSFFSGSDFAELHAAIESLGHMVVLSELAPREGAAHRPASQCEREAQQCPICLDTISDMVELSCNHRFCWKCFVLGPIAFQPGEYRITQCPICRTETTQSPQLGDADAAHGLAGVGVPSSEGLLTRFLHTYFPKGQTDNDDDDQQEATKVGEQSEREMRDVVGELVRALLADSTALRPAIGGGGTGSRCSQPWGAGSADDGPEEGDGPDGSGAAASAVPGDFFQTLPQRAPPERQLIGAAQKLQWLQLASTGDSFALDGNMYCSLCSDPLLMEVVVSTPCKHHFHRVCVSRLEEPKCPLCGGELPFNWFIPTEHPCAEHGFRVVPNREYRPQFAGGPSRGSFGYPLHRPPPVSLRGPGGISMKSYLHKIVPMGPGDELDGVTTPRTDAAASPETASPSCMPRHHEDPEGSSVSETSSEESNSEDGGDRDHGSGPTKKGKAHSWAYSAIGKMRLMDPYGTSEASFQPEAALAGSADSASASSADMNMGSVPDAASAEPEQRNPTVLLIGRHL